MSLLCKSSRFSGAGREKLVEIPQLHSSYSCLDKVVHTPVVCNDRCPDGTDARKLCRFRSCSTFERGRCPCYAGAQRYRRYSSLAMDVPVIMQRRCSLEQWKCIRFSSSPDLVDIPVRNRRAFSAHFAPFFGLPREWLSPRVFGFFEPSMTKSSSSLRAPRGAGVAGTFTPR